MSSPRRFAGSLRHIALELERKNRFDSSSDSDDDPRPVRLAQSRASPAKARQPLANISGRVSPRDVQMALENTLPKPPSPRQIARSSSLTHPRDSPKARGGPSPHVSPRDPQMRTRDQVRAILRGDAPSKAPSRARSSPVSPALSRRASGASVQHMTAQDLDSFHRVSFREFFHFPDVSELIFE